MTTNLAFTDSPVIESGNYVNPGAGSLVPSLMWIGQASGIVVATVCPPEIFSTDIHTYTLYRASAPNGPWTQIDARSPSPQSRWQNLFDQAPLFGQRAYYYVTVDGPLQSNMLYFSATASPVPIAPGGTLSAGAFGPYPLLGSDVFINPATGEAIIGPNGDMLSVNGLELLGQDLRTRIITQQGELPLHPQFGLTRERVIGSGQSDPGSQAQTLQALFIDALTADPRVLSIQTLTIAAVAFDSWLIDVTLVAIGVEDEQRLNIVVPYFNA